MKTFTKKILTSVILITVIAFTLNAQTNVSGGIYANTTWTLANSPYIVVDTVVVFPNVTLTIEPGVVVKFENNKRIEIRQAKLMAIGTSADSIAFTSNASSPTPGIYPGIYLNGGNLTSTFNYCNFRYATIAVNATVSDSVIVNHSNFSGNITGMQFVNPASGVAIIGSSNFNNNTNGLILEDLYHATINYCNFSYDSITGLILGNPMFASSTFSSTTSYCNFSNDGTGLLMDMEFSILDSCHFSNDTMGLKGSTGQGNFVYIYPNIVKNCIFDFNQTGLKTDHILIDSCMIIHNQSGYIAFGVSRIKNCTVDSNSVIGLSTYNDSIVNCNIKFNGVGIHSASFTAIIGNDIEYNTGANISSSTFLTNITGNTIRYGSVGIDNVTGSFFITSNIIDNNNLGVNLNSSTGTISCNRICNNATYDLQYGASSNLDASHNYWCTSDSAFLETLIYDGYDNINYGLVSFMPFDSLCAPVTTSVNDITQGTLPFSIFPNPAADNLTVVLPSNCSKAEIKIFNMLGELAYSSTATKQKTTIDISTLNKGAYIMQISTAGRTSRQKLIRQ
jgi:hypothetical protein